MEIRTKLNEEARNWGNRRTPKLKENYGYGLGDFLTQEITMPKVGAGVGYALLPLTERAGIVENVDPWFLTPWPYLLAGLGACAGWGLREYVRDRKGTA